MAAQRPKRNNSPVNSKNQPLKATVPYSSLVKNPSPTRRRTSPSSPGLPPDKRNRLRRSPDVSIEQRSLLSPLGSKELFKPVSKNRKNIRRTSSLDTLSTYMNGQWPKETNVVLIKSNLQHKSTQTPFLWNESSSDDHVSHHSYDQRKSIANTTNSKQIFRQVLQRSKQQSQPTYGKLSSPVQGDHSAASLTQQYFTPASYTPSKPVSIPQVPSSPKNTSLHTRRSVEGLNFELQGLDLGDDYMFARTPPEGRRPPVPGLTTKNVTTHTQTSNGWIDNTPLSPSSRGKRSRSTSPSWPTSPTEYRTPTKEVSDRSLSALLPNGRASPDHQQQTTHVPKYASSPKPNNSFWFARGPPDGAEKIPSSVEDIKGEEMEEDYLNDETVSCPDVSKCQIQFSKNSPFYSLPSY